MNDKIWIVMETCIKEEGKEGVSWEKLLKISVKALTSFFDNLTHKNVEFMLSDAHSYLPVFETLSKIVEERFPSAEIIRQKGPIDRERHYELNFRRALKKNPDFFMMTEQDYLYTPGAIEKVLDVFEQMPKINLVSLYDHPSKYRNTHPENDFLFDEWWAIPPRYFTKPVLWQKVSCCGVTAIWRMSWVKEYWQWFEDLIERGNFRDPSSTFDHYKRGNLILEPVESAIQHMQVDHSQDSPTFPEEYEV